MHARQLFLAHPRALIAAAVLALSIAALALTVSLTGGERADLTAWNGAPVGPTVTIDTMPADPSNSADAAFDFTVTGVHDRVICGLDGALPVDCDSLTTHTYLVGDGPHTAEISGVDGMVTGSPATFSWTVDTVAPVTMIDSAVSPTNDATPTIEFSAEAGSTFECSVDGGAYASCVSPYTTPPVSDGSHSLEISATDLAGNVEAPAMYYSFEVDTLAPVVTIDAGETLTSDSTPSFTFSADSISTFECSIDSGPFVACTSPIEVPALSDGSHGLVVRATDAADNQGLSSSFAFVIDTVAPETSAVAGVASGAAIRDTTPTFTFAGDAGATFECKLDAAAFAACASPYTLPTTANGLHTFTVRARDAAGNIEATPMALSFTIDTVAPNTRITASPSRHTTSRRARFTFTSTEPGSRFQCKRDAKAWTACTSPRVYTRLSYGWHTVKVRAIDAAGNVDGSPSSKRFHVMR